MDSELHKERIRIWRTIEGFYPTIARCITAAARMVEGESATVADILGDLPVAQFRLSLAADITCLYALLSLEDQVMGMVEAYCETIAATMDAATLPAQEEQESEPAE